MLRLFTPRLLSACLLLAGPLLCASSTFAAETCASAALPAPPPACAAPAPARAKTTAAAPARVTASDAILVNAADGVQQVMGAPEARVTAAMLERTAGTLDDPMRYFQILPGVLSDSDQRNDFLVRGGNPSETLFVVDGIEVPSINQLALSDTTGGLVSMIDSNAVESMTLHSGAHDARFTDRLSSVVEISTVGNAAARRTFEAGLGGVGGLLSWRFHDRGSVLVSERQGILDLLTNDIGMNGVPKYNNNLARFDHLLGQHDRLWGMSLTGIDSIAIRPDYADPWETNPFDINYHGWRNTTGINWQHMFGGRSFGVLTASNAQQSQTIVEYDQVLHGVPSYDERTRDGDTTLKYELSAQAFHWLLVSGGGTVSAQRVNYGIDQPVPLPSPYSSSPVSTSQTAIHTSFSALMDGGFAQATALLPAGMRFTLAARATHWGFDGETRYTPKALLAIPLGRTRSLAVGYAEYAQLPPNLYLLAFPQNHALAPIKAQHFTFDVGDLVHTRRFTASLAAYEKRYTDYPVAAAYPQLSLANIADTFGNSFLLFPMVSMGRGRVAGAEASFEARPTSRLILESSVTYARTRYSGLDGVLRRGNFDIPFSANVAGVLRLGASLSLSARYSGASGRPYTPDNWAESLAQQRDVYDLTRVNALRSQAYGRLDFRLQQTRTLGRRSFTWHVGLDNALGRKNFYSLLWQPHAPVPGQAEQYQMPLFPDGGVKYTF